MGFRMANNCYKNLLLVFKGINIKTYIRISCLRHMDVLWTYLLFSVALNLFLFIIAYIFQTDKITDVSYSLTFMAISAYAFFQSELSMTDTILLLLVVTWALRLGMYLAYRIIFMGRDKRFDKIRKSFTSFLAFWLMQGLTCFIVMIPVLLSHQTEMKSMVFLSWIGAMIAIFGLVFETIADFQKFIYKKSSPTSFMNKGLWSIVQHPNYLGELLFWWGIFLVSLPYSLWYISIIGPVWISFIIIKFSGISILQRRWKTQYGTNPDFKDYQKKTRKLIPFFY